jgi:dipeptidyl aminopeptidase/acylaminoacyl peptidase
MSDHRASFSRASGRRPLPWALGLIAVLVAFGAMARPVRFDDVLRRQGFGAIEVTPTGRLLVEAQSPFEAGPRFDYGDMDVMFRSRLMVADAAHGGRLQPLFHQDTNAGYALGPASPDGRYVAVYRLAKDRYELGIVEVATRRARWLRVTPEAPYLTRTLQWTAASQLFAVVLEPTSRRSPTVLPYDLRAVRPQWELPARWAASAAGRASVTVAGSGRYIADHPAGPSKAVVRIAPLSGQVTILSRGEAVDLEVSASGRHVAVLEAAEPVPLSVDHTVQGTYGLAVRRARLRVIDVEAGRSTVPCPSCDVLTGLMAWAPDREALLVFVRDDGAPWTAGHLLRIDAPTGVGASVPGDVAAALTWRPERVSAAWWDGDPLLFGRRPGETRDDWYRLSGRGPVKLTSDLGQAPRNSIVVAGSWLIAAADGGGWRIDKQGHAIRMNADPFRPLLPRYVNVPARTVYTIGYGEGLAGVQGEGAAAQAGVLMPAGQLRHAVGLPAGASLAALTDRGAVTIDGVGSGPQTLSWRAPSGRAAVLAAINRQLAEVTWPNAVPVDQPGADGSILRHWVFLPPSAGRDRPAPLVVIPYPGSSYRSAPQIWADDTMGPATALIAAGYAVLMPSLPSPKDGRGPGEGLADRVLAAVDAAGATPDLRGRIDVSRLGAWGHSFGGFAAVTLLTQSDRFGAAVSVEGRVDLVSSWGQFSVARRMNPDNGPSVYYSAGWAEDLQGDMGAPPFSAAERYIANSPIFFADKIHRPLMLVAGDMDGSHVGQAEEMFSALYRQNKDAVLLTYWGEEHGFGSPGNLRDLYRRGVAFLDAYLKPQPATPPDGEAHGPHRESASANAVPTTRPRLLGTGPDHRRAP